MQSEMSMVRLFLNLKGLCPNLEAISAPYISVCFYQRKSEIITWMPAILYWCGSSETQISLFYSDFVGSTQAALWHQKGLGRTEGHRKYQVVLSSLNHSCSMARRVLTFSVYRSSEIFTRGVSSAVCFIFKCQETLLPPKSVPLKLMKL